jgi:hypothetical protein
MSRPAKITQRIKVEALKILERHPEGMRYSELHAAISASDSAFKSGSISGCISNLDVHYPEFVYKPARGRFRLLRFKEPAVNGAEAPDRPQEPPEAAGRVPEEAFYAPFADWLKNEIEDVTQAIPLGRNVFRDKWGTPDVIGKRAPRASDIIKGPVEIVSAEIKADTQQLVTAFGQACAYKLFSDKVYLVVPRQSQEEEIARLDSLCQIFGIGLVTFDAEQPAKPDFRILVRPVRHQPDYFYTNRCLARIENELFS